MAVRPRPSPAKKTARMTPDRRIDSGRASAMRHGSSRAVRFRANKETLAERMVRVSRPQVRAHRAV